MAKGRTGAKWVHRNKTRIMTAGQAVCVNHVYHTSELIRLKSGAVKRCKQ